MPQTLDDTNKTVVKTSKQTLQGPDGKWYSVKKGDENKFDQHFTKQGWIKKDNVWYTQTGEKSKMSVPSQTPGFTAKLPIGGLGLGGERVGISLEDRNKQMPSFTKDYTGTALPTIFGGVGGTVGGSLGAGVGGALGQILKTIMVRPSFLEKDPSTQKQIADILLEGGKQAGLEYAGGKIGDGFFKLLNKIPHAVIKDGIKFLPSELKEGGTVSRYVEDLLSNLATSANTIETFKNERNKVILNHTEQLAQGFSRFNGTSEELGIIMQKSIRQAHENIDKGLESTYQGYIKKGFTEKQAELYLSKTSLAKQMKEYFDNELASKIIKTNKPEEIAGFIRAKAALQDVRQLHKTLIELSPDMMGKVQNRLMRDFLQEAITGSKDPTAKGAQELTKHFAGDRFKKIIDTVGEEKLKAIYGENGYKRLEDFIKLTGTIGTGRQGSGVGKFLNLVFIYPFRGGINIHTLLRSAGMAFAFNRAAKIITSPEGMGIYEGLIKVLGSNSPRLINLSLEELKKFNQRSDEEFSIEQQQAEEEYKKIKTSENLTN